MVAINVRSTPGVKDQRNGPGTIDLDTHKDRGPGVNGILAAPFSADFDCNSRDARGWHGHRKDIYFRAIGHRNAFESGGVMLDALIRQPRNRSPQRQALE